MKLSIYPCDNPFPANKDEKRDKSKLASMPHRALTSIIDNEYDLFEAITSYMWCPSIFVDGERKKDRFSRTDFMVLDMDNGITLDKAQKRVEQLGLACMIAPTVSHTPQVHRFRMVFILEKPIHDNDTFLATWMDLTRQFPESDAACKDSSRFFFPCNPEADGAVWIEGSLLKVKKAPESSKNSPVSLSSGIDRIDVGEDIEDVVKALYGENKDKIPEQVDFFIREAHTGLPGMWHTSFNSFVFTLALQGVDFDVVYSVAESLAPQALDAHDEYLLERAYNDGVSKRD